MADLLRVTTTTPDLHSAKKLARTLVSDAGALIRRHPWQNPEITAVALAGASEAYAQWLPEATGSED